MERWRQPFTAKNVETHEKASATFAGRTYRDYDVAAEHEQVQRLREGRVCINCWEPQEKPFPGPGEHLPGCQVNIKRDQAELFARLYEGEKWVGPRLSLEEVRALDDEAKARETHTKRDSHIWVPRSPD